MFGMLVLVHLDTVKFDAQSYMSEFNVTEEIHRRKNISTIHERYKTGQMDGRLKSKPEWETVNK